MEKFEFSTRIKELRESLQMTQTQFSEFIGIKQQTLSGYERGIMKPPLDVATFIARKCHVSIDWLCGLSDKKRHTDSVETYSELYDCLLSIGEKTNLRFETVSYIGGYDEPITMHTQSIWFDNIQICNFMEEWHKMKTLHDDGAIDDDVYNLWKEKVLAKSANEKERLDGKFITDDLDINDEVPFN
ncbi:MAG: helix-turn-helix transcriptional regulator [Lachnospiraceae bacterium]|jgi:transcriptional regulator with XRE-family HTH domain|nr:helix-turn-helix transcriptional regulator [Lachnospiraceae bacterium]